jgi:hypothetical protein
MVAGLSCGVDGGQNYSGDFQVFKVQYFDTAGLGQCSINRPV